MQQGRGGLDDAAFTAIYDEYFPRVYNYAYYRLLHREDAEDVVSTVFCKVYAHIGSFDSSRAALGTWIMRICKNTLIDYYRTKKLSSSIDELEESGRAPSVDFEEQYRLISSPERRELLKVLAALPERDRTIIYYKYFEGRKNSEIAAEMGLNASTVGTLLMRSRAQLRELLADHNAD